MAGKQAFELSIDIFLGWSFFDPEQTNLLEFGRLCSVSRPGWQGCRASQAAKPLIELSYAAIPWQGRSIPEEFDRVVANGTKEQVDESVGFCSGRRRSKLSRLFTMLDPPGPPVRTSMARRQVTVEWRVASSQKKPSLYNRSRRLEVFWASIESLATQQG